MLIEIIGLIWYAIAEKEINLEAIILQRFLRGFYILQAR